MVENSKSSNHYLRDSKIWAHSYIKLHLLPLEYTCATKTQRANTNKQPKDINAEYDWRRERGLIELILDHKLQRCMHPQPLI
jgi:hypothetical protein